MTEITIQHETGTVKVDDETLADFEAVRLADEIIADMDAEAAHNPDTPSAAEIDVMRHEAGLGPTPCYHDVKVVDVERVADELVRIDTPLICSRCGEPLCAEITVHIVAKPITLPSVTAYGLTTLDDDSASEIGFSLHDNEITNISTQQVFCTACDKTYYAA